MGNNDMRLGHFDLLRALAILYILMFWHLDDYVGNPWHYPFTEMVTYGALNIFVYISSFLLTLKHGELKSFEMVVGFLKKRVLRIYPLYFLAVIIFYWLFDLTRYELLSALFLVNMLTGASIATLWFIGLIFFYYLVLAFILYRFSWRKFVVISLLFLGSTGTIFILTGQLDKRVVLYFPAFVLGIITGKQEDIRELVSGVPFTVASFFAAAGMLAGYYLFLNDWSTDLGKLSLYCGGFFLILPACELARWFSGRWKVNVFSFLSYASFCMYLSHRIIYYLLLVIFRPQGEFFVLTYLLIVGVPIVILVSSLLQYGNDYLMRWGS